MAMSLPQQIGALSGMPIVADSGTVFGDLKSATVNASAVWRSPARSLWCVAARAGEIDRVSPSPPLSPKMRLMRPDLSVACQALMEAAPAEEVVVVREYKEGGAKVKGKGVPVYVMMPLDSVTMENTVSRRKAMNVSLQAMNGKAINAIMFNVRGLNLFNGQLKIEASFNIASNSRVDIEYCNSTITPNQLMNVFRKNYELLLDIFNPEGWLEITYVDDTLRIGRDDKGNIFILERYEENKT